MTATPDFAAPSVQTDEAASADGGRDGDAVLLALGDGSSSPQAIELARTMAVGRDCELVVVNAVRLPEQTPLDHPSRTSEASREPVTAILERLSETNPELTTSGGVHVGRKRSRVLAAAVDRYDAGVVVVDAAWHDVRLAPAVRTPVERLRSRVDCPVVVATDSGLPETVSSVLVPVAGGPHSNAAVDVARAVAAGHDAWIQLLHVNRSTAPPGQHSGERIIDDCVAQLGEFDRYDTFLIEADDVVETIVEQSRYHDVTVIGAPRKPRLRRFVFGSRSRAIRKGGPRGVVTAHA